MSTTFSSVSQPARKSAKVIADADKDLLAVQKATRNGLGNPRVTAKAIQARFEAEFGETLLPSLAEALPRCFAQTGKAKGRLKMKKPSAWPHSKNADPMAALLWDAIQPNPYKLSCFGMFTKQTPEEARQINMFKSVIWPSWLDLDKDNLQSLGVW